MIKAIHPTESPLANRQKIMFSSISADQRITEARSLSPGFFCAAVCEQIFIKLDEKIN